jgi:RNA recognition motif-containing protein
MSVTVRGTLVDVKEQYTIDLKHATDPTHAAGGELQLQTQPEEEVSADDAGYNTPDDFLDDNRMEQKSWSMSNEHEQAMLQSAESIWQGVSCEDLSQYGMVDTPCMWQTWMVPVACQIPTINTIPVMEEPAPEPDREKDVGDDAQWSGVQTVMIRGLPKKLTQQMLLEETNSRGFGGTYDFVYLPMDLDTKANRGYAFINFVDPAFALAFKTSYQGHQMVQFNSRKVIAVLPAVLQGFEANYVHFATARVSREDSVARPLFLRQPSDSTLAKVVETSERRKRVADGGAAKTAAAASEAPQARQRAGARFASKNVPAQGSGVKDSRYDNGVAAGQRAEQAKYIVNFCPFCGGRVNKGFKFCQFCGASMML